MEPGITDYVVKETRKRDLRSLGISLLAYLLLFLLLWGWESLFRQDLDMAQGPVLIRLGEPEGADKPSPPTPPKEEAAKPEETTPPKVEETVETDSPLPKPEEVVTQDDSPTPEETAPEEIPTTVKDAPPALPEPIKGSDAGNNYELTSMGGEIGQSLWTPIYLYMPLPRLIESQITPDGGLGNLLEAVQPDDVGLNTIKDNQNLLKKYYSVEGDKLRLVKPVALSNRSEIWIILERAGYDINLAEYKSRGGILKPVKINFTVVSSGSSEANIFEELELASSSGDPDVDEAVLYGFEKSSYYSKSEESIKGRFTYQFR